MIEPPQQFAFISQILDRFPDLKVTYDLGKHSWMDIEIGIDVLTVEHRPGVGYGLHHKGDDNPMGGPEIVVSEQNISELVQLCEREITRMRAYS